MNVDVNAWLQVAAACWLYAQFETAKKMPAWITSLVVWIGVASVGLVIASEVWPIATSTVRMIMAQVSR